MNYSPLICEVTIKIDGVSQPSRLQTVASEDDAYGFANRVADDLLKHFWDKQKQPPKGP